MQTFLPYPNYADSARCLDRQRLGKQRVEVLQLLRCLTGLTTGWRNHPAARMWRGHEGHLLAYGLAACLEWRRRGYRDSCAEKMVAVRGGLPISLFPLPPWLGNPAFHASHRAALLAKNPAWYGRFGWAEEPGIAYVWPVR